MTDHRALVDQYLKKAFPSAAITDGHDNERHGHWWAIKQNNKTMALHVSKEFLTLQSEDAARAQLNNFNPAKALQGSAGRAVLLAREGVTYVPETPA